MAPTANSPVDIALRFVDRINAHDVPGMVRLMTPDHLFVDSLGEEVRGRDEMRRAWVQYFYLFPEFTITCRQIFQREQEVALFGTAGGRYTLGTPLPVDDRWQMPAAWRAVVRGGSISEWHVYADNEPVRRLMALQGGG
jgi:hypothetical protein